MISKGKKRKERDFERNGFLFYKDEEKNSWNGSVKRIPSNIKEMRVKRTSF